MMKETGEKENRAEGSGNGKECKWEERVEAGVSGI